MNREGGLGTTEEILKNRGYSGHAKNLLKKLWSKEITQEEFLQECAYWYMKDSFNALAPKTHPLRPNTPAFREFAMLSPEKQKKVDTQLFKENSEILEHINRVEMVNNENLSNLIWLLQIKGYLTGDTVMENRLKNKILEFMDVLGITDKLEFCKRYGLA